MQAIAGRESTTNAAGRLVIAHIMPQDNHTALLDLVEAGHHESRFGDIPFSRAKAQRQLDAALADRRRHLVAAAWANGQPKGFVYASVGEYIVGTGALIVTINAIYTSQSLRSSLLGGRAAVGLLKAVGRWSNGIGAREVLLHATSGIDGERVGRCIKRLSFEMIGGTYALRTLKANIS